MKKYKETIKKIILFLKARIRYPFRKMPRYKVLSIEETCRIILDKRVSVVRFGDGELMMMDGKSLDHQCYDTKLSLMLKEVICSKDILVCLPESLSNCNILRFKSNIHWRTVLLKHKHLFAKYLDRGRVYGNAFITRPYLIYKNKTNCEERFLLLRQMWENKKLLLIEGEYSCSGVGNDLFENSTSIKRIICPSKNAFDIYDSLLYRYWAWYIRSINISSNKKFATSNITIFTNLLTWYNTCKCKKKICLCI